MATATQSIREIVSAEPLAAAVLEGFEIDLCSQADTELERVCADLQLSVEQVLEKLADAEAQAHGVIVPNVESYSLTRLIQHIVRIHHQTVRQDLPRYADLAQRIAGKQGGDAPHFKTAAKLIEQLCRDMRAHIQKEEQMLFPYIVRLEEVAADGSPVPPAVFRTVLQPVSTMVREHDAAEGIMMRLRQLTNGFEPPAWACPRNTAFHAGLAAFAQDLRRHVHLENDLLFPRAVALEAELVKRSQP